VNYIIIIFGVILLAVFLITHFRAEKPIASAVISMLGGIISLFALSWFNLLSVNYGTTFVSLALGIPGTAISLILSYLH
jgi:hypothetical protein